MKRVQFVGLDVHADTIAVAVAEPGGSPVGSRRLCADCPHPAPSRVARRLPIVPRPGTGRRLLTTRLTARGESRSSTFM